MFNIGEILWILLCVFVLGLLSGRLISGEGPGERWIWIEAERVLSNPSDSHSGATERLGGGASANCYVISGKSFLDHLSYVLRVPKDMEEAMFSVRYSCPACYTYFKLGSRLKVWKVLLDGKEIFPLVLPPTHPQDHKGEPVWSFASIPLGKLSRGDHRIILRPMAENWRYQLNLDGFYVHDGMARFADGLDKENKLPGPTFVPPTTQKAAKASADVLSIPDGDVFVGLNGMGWRFRTDPKDEGELNHWHEPAFDDSTWKKVDLWKAWESQGFSGYDGAAWYRRTIAVPKTWKEKEVRLYICHIMQYGWVYVNGKLVHVSWDPDPQGACLVPGGVGGVGSKSISTHLRFGEENVIAIKIWNCAGAGGVAGPALIYATERFDDREGAFRIVSPSPDERYGVILGYYANALTWPAGFHSMLLAEKGEHCWPAHVMEKIPIPRHLMNRSTPLCVARKSEIERYLTKKPRTLDLDEVSPFAMRTSETKIDSIRPVYPEEAGYLDVVIKAGSAFKRDEKSVREFSLLGDGPVDEALVPSHLHGKQREGHGGPAVFLVNFPVQGEFSVLVDKIGLDAPLRYG